MPADDGFLDAPFAVTPEQKLEFERDGVTMLRGVVPDIKGYAPHLRLAWAEGVKEFALAEAQRLGCHRAEATKHLMVDITPPAQRRGLSDLPTSVDVEMAVQQAVTALSATEECSKALKLTVEDPNDKMRFSVKYFQALNLRRFNARVERWALSGRLASAAAQLLDTDVRLYQDAFFRKGDTRGHRLEIFSQATAIHAEGDLIPVDTDKYVTAWCPLRPVNTTEDSGLFFFPGSHRLLSPKKDMEAQAFHEVSKEREYKKKNAARNGHNKATQKFENFADDVYDALLFLDKKKAERKMDYSDTISGVDMPDLPARTQLLMERFCEKNGMDTYWPVAKAQSSNDLFSELRKVVPEHQSQGRVAQGYIYARHALQCLLSKSGRSAVAEMRNAFKSVAEERNIDGWDDLFDRAVLVDQQYVKNFWGSLGGAFDYGFYDIGDCSMHHGGTLHAAPPQPEQGKLSSASTAEARPPREAVSLSFVAKEARKVPAHLWESLWGEGMRGEDNEDFLSYSRWWSKVTDDQLVEADSILPVVWPQANATEGIAPPRPAASPF